MIWTLTREHKDSWTGIIAYQDCQAQISPEIDRNEQPVIDLKPAQARELEIEAGLGVGELSPSSPYWVKFFIPLKGVLKLDDTNPIDKIRLAVLRPMKKVAVGREELKVKSKAVYLLTSESLDTKSESVKFDVKESAWKAFFTLSDTQARQVAVVLEKKKPRGRVTDVSSMDIGAIKNKLRAEVERDPKLFVEIAEDDTLATKFEILELVTQRVMSTNASGYYHKSDLIGSDLDDAASFWTDPHNQARVIQIKKEAQVRAKK